ncbi:MAG: hypothetical protein IKY67_03610 [Paludibacteraceae bacterium]|nr:hypothetical protein [Paludibacteraceae bacterium]
MKTLKFFLLAVVAVVFFACEQPTTGPSFSLSYGDQEIVNGAVIDVTMDHYAWGEIVAHVLLKNNGSATTFTMKEVRNYDYTKYVPSFCVSQCMMGNGEKEQLWEPPFEVATGEEQDLAMHLKVNAFVDGEEIFQESANCPGVFTISNGTESIEFTLNFIYDKAAIPAE